MTSFSVWSSECPSDEEIGLSDCSDDSPELAVLRQPTGTLITSRGTESRALRAAGRSAGGAASSCFSSKATSYVVRICLSKMAISDKAQKSALRCQKRPFLITHCFLITFSDTCILSENRGFLTRCTLSENVVRNGRANPPHHGNTQHTGTHSNTATNHSISVVRWLPPLMLLLLLFLAGAQLIV